MKRRFRALTTVRRLYTLLIYGYCPACNSSPPRPGCVVCDGGRVYGAGLSRTTRADWAARWVAFRYEPR